jgi:hypothetical protein
MEIQSWILKQKLNWKMKMRQSWILRQMKQMQMQKQS